MSELRHDLGRPNVLEVSLKAIEHNVAVLKSAVDGRRIIGVLKADGYGYGAVEVARRAAAAGIDELALADLDRAVAIREAGVGVPILVYVGTPLSATVVAAYEEYDLTPTIHTSHGVRELEALTTKTIDAFIKVDVGLERIGIYPESIGDTLAELRENQKVRLRGVYAHLHVPSGATSDIAPYLRWQLGRFAIVERALVDAGLPKPLLIAASSGVLWRTAEGFFDGIDPGRLLYGIGPASDAAQVFETRPALVSLKSRLVEVKQVRRADFAALSPLGNPAPTRLGIMPIGLVDGMPNFVLDYVLVRGRRAQLVGAPSLEYTRLELDGIEDAQSGDEVVLVGTQGAERIVPEDVLALRDPSWMNGLALRAASSVRRVYLD